MKHIFKIILVSVFLLVLMDCNSSKVAPISISTKIDSLIQTKNPRSFSGVVVISENGKIIYSKAKGFSGLNENIPVNIDSRFSTMSIAKQITAALVLREVEKGNIKLNEPISKYLKDIPFSWTNRVKIENLLNNSSGIEAWELKENLSFQPGTKFQYSNIGYSLLGEILEKASGKTYRNLVTNLFSEIGMKNSSYPSQRDGLITSYFIKKDKSVNVVTDFPYKNKFFPGSHLVVSAGDLVKWNQALHEGKILNKDSYQKMVQYNVTNAHSLFGEKEIGYGYGLRINDKSEVFEIGHTGFSPPAGFTAVNLYYPKNKISVIVLENTATEDFDHAYFFEEGIRNIIIKSKLVK